MTDESRDEIARQVRLVIIEIVAFTVLASAIALVLALTA